jgi:hypothetical protein
VQPRRPLQALLPAIVEVIVLGRSSSVRYLHRNTIIVIGLLI